ncbi:DUF4393 domain-containing protein [Methylophaga sp. SB9B]|uniref:Abi-alpha family protein n=1 Tax=Methylophaga sp. SB9B TaxID=2570356 RepID=UPI0010A7D93F|nr:Abi-alpha family protein [Methylophaga sp. SB9B]THK41325.1 DUF4393 domain-containing protein [Methylophaga sp. SB9B]
MKEELEIVEKLSNSKVVEKIYDDGLSSPLVEVSKIGTDLVKSARLILAPLQLAASFQDRFEFFLKNLNKRVVKEDQVQPPAELTSVCIERMKYIDLNNPLWDMFEELLIKAMDKNSISQVHPSFAQIIGQLSPDEALLMYELSKGDFEVTDQMDLNYQGNRFENRRVLSSTIPKDKLANPDAFEIYYAHLESLSLITWPVINETPVHGGGRQTGTKRNSRILLSDFGKLFVAACIPESGFNKIS